MQTTAAIRQLKTTSFAVVGASLLFAAAASATGCSKYYISNTDVEDTTENRKIVAFCELYRRAVERRDVPGLLELASKHYYEDGGNVDASDDIDYAGLKEYLSSRFEDTISVRYEIRYRRVTAEETHVFVDFTYSGSFRLPSGEGEKWRNTVEENRLELVAKDDSYVIVAGM